MEFWKNDTSTFNELASNPPTTNSILKAVLPSELELAV